MNNVTEIVTLLRQQAALEIQIMNAGGPAVAAEWALATTRQRLVAYPEALEIPSQGTHYHTNDRHPSQLSPPPIDRRFRFCQCNARGVEKHTIRAEVRENGIWNSRPRL